MRRAGFEGASFPVGIDDDGRERLVFIDGEVPAPPYPDWSQSDSALASIARLLRAIRLHRFSLTLMAVASAFSWSMDFTGPLPVCSNIYP